MRSSRSEYEGWVCKFYDGGKRRVEQGAEREIFLICVRGLAGFVGLITIASGVVLACVTTTIFEGKDQSGRSRVCPPG
jgi:hypothetical protein